jgi:proteasome accessory factor B
MRGRLTSVLVSAKKTERLLNLVICLLHTRRYLSVQEIRTAVPGYDSGSEEAFRRMFERDKEELRDLGIPLETGSDTAAHDDEIGYRIARRDYELPPISLEPDEAAALGLAARLWQSAPLAGATGSALLKLRAAGVDAPDSVGALEPRVGQGEPAFDACLAAVTEGRSLRFDYRATGRPAPEERSIDPWGVVWWHGRWYVVGHDTARDDVRVFRLSRIVGEATAVGEPGTVKVPPDTDLRALVARMAAEEPRATAAVRVRAGAAWALRREAISTEPGDGSDVLRLGYSDPERFAERVAGYGADVVVLEPPEARDAVVRRLQALSA